MKFNIRSFTQFSIVLLAVTIMSVSIVIVVAANACDTMPVPARIEMATATNNTCLFIRLER